MQEIFSELSYNKTFALRSAAILSPKEQGGRIGRPGLQFHPVVLFEEK